MINRDEYIDHERESNLSHSSYTGGNEVNPKHNSISRELSEKDKEVINGIYHQLDGEDTSTVLNLGAGTQKNITSFSEKMIEDIQTRDAGEIGKEITTLVTTLNSTDLTKQESKNIFTRLFNKGKNKITEQRAKYSQLSTQIDKMGYSLENSSHTIEKDNGYIKQAVNESYNYVDELDLYIIAGNQKIDDLGEEVRSLQLSVKENPNDSRLLQKFRDKDEYLTRLHKRVHDLELTRQMTFQMIPQFQTVMATNNNLIEKIRSSVNTVIPLWKQQGALAVTLKNQEDALRIQKAVSSTTNEMMRANAEMLSVSAIETARENERGIIDVETLKSTQESMIDTLKEVMRIQSEGRSQREEAIKTLRSMDKQTTEILIGKASDTKLLK